MHNFIHFPLWRLWDDSKNTFIIVRRQSLDTMEPLPFYPPFRWHWL